MSHRFQILFLLVLLGLPLAGCAGSGFRTDDHSLGYRQLMEAQREQALAETRGDEQPVANTVEARIAEGDRRLSKGDRQHALWQYSEARRLDPHHPRPLERLGFFHLSEDPERSASYFTRALEMDPEASEAHLGLGLARLAQGRFEEARRSLERSAEIDPQLASAQDALGVTYALLERPEEAFSHTQRASELNPRSAWVLNNVGVAWLTQGDFAAAERAFRKASLVNPDDPAIYNNLGLALGRQHRYEEAETAFRRFGSEQAVHNNLGYVAHLNGDWDRAIRHYEAALRTDGDARLTVLRNLDRTVAARGR